MKAKPFVKWVGGKTQLIDQLEAMLPADFDQWENVTYIEPFVGGGAMLFHMLQRHSNIKSAIINDINEDLTTCYKVVKHSPQLLVESLKEIQKELKSGLSPNEIAILFRTNNEARVLVETLMEYNQPYYMKEHFPNLYEHFIAKNFIGYMKMALGDRSRKLFLEIMNRPNRYIGRDSVNSGEISFEALKKIYADKEWMQDRIDQFDVDLRIIKRCKPYAAIQYIRKHIGYDDFLKEYAIKRRIKLEELMDIVHEIEEERRLFYVAMTRAKKRLVISYSKERNGKKMKQSRFVGELLNLKK